MITLKKVSKRYTTIMDSPAALLDVDVSIEPGERVAVVGPSGSGKSTLLNIMGLLALPTAGEVLVAGQETTCLSPSKRAALRNRMIGFVFQSYGLLPELTVAENVELPLIYAGIRRNRRASVMKTLSSVGIEGFADGYPPQLSGGQQQRVAIARALVTGAPLIMADEPTGALDSKTGADVMNLLCELAAAGRTLIIVTHSADVAARCNRIIHVRDGQLQPELARA